MPRSSILAVLVMVMLSMIIASTTGFSIQVSDVEYEETAAVQELQAVLEVYSEQYEVMIRDLTEALWGLTRENCQHRKDFATATQNETFAFLHEAAENLTQFDTSNLPYSLKRQVAKFLDTRQTDYAFRDVGLKTLHQTALNHLYRSGQVCVYDRCLIITELNEMMAWMRNFDVLRLLWTEWRKAIGGTLKLWFPPFVTITNKVANLANYSNAPEFWWSPYEADGLDFDTEMSRLIDEVFPLYQQLHAYARRKLKELYGDRFPATGHIPAHALGDMWAHQWSTLLRELVPFRGKPSIDVTQEMLRQNYTVLEMFQTADDFFESIGLGRMSSTFWRDSMLEKPSDNRSVICAPTAWDFYNNDSRVSVCSYVITEDLVMAHHLLADMHYILQYQDQPVLLREPVNPAFKEAVGNAIELLVQTPYHMDYLGLLNISVVDNETDINFLLYIALQKIAFLPFAYVVEKWRMDVFRGNITEEQYNDYWWELRCIFQGVSPPVERTATDFDPGSVYHILLNTPFTSNFLGFIMQFQFHKAMCQAAGHSGPLHKCDISDSKDAGQLLKNMMSLGASRPWPDAMEAMTGQRSVSAGPLLEYFDPLLQYLEKENGADTGWQDDC